MKNTLFLFVFVFGLTVNLLAQSEKNESVDFLDKVKETPAKVEKPETFDNEAIDSAEIKEAKKESSSIDVVPEVVEKKTPAQLKKSEVVSKRKNIPLKKKENNYSTPEWIESISDTNDDFLLGNKKPEVIPVDVPSEIKKENEEKITAPPNFLSYFDGMGRYKKALIIIVLLILFAVYRMRSGGGKSGGGSKRTPVTINKSINKYRK